MRLSRLFSKTSKTHPSDETAKNAQLLLRAGFVTKSMAGAYTFLPLGLRVLTKVENIVRKHMNSIGGQELLMNNLQPKEWWERVGSWDHDANDVLFHVPSHNLPGTEYALSSSNEENVTTTVAQFVNSYKDLPEYTEGSIVWPLSLYHIHTKFRDEVRSKAGLMRGREFRMKDMYDFHQAKSSQAAYFEVITNTYLQCFAEIGLNALVVNASGGSFSDKFSREFQVFCEAGEDRLYVVPSRGTAYNEEVAPVLAPHTTQEGGFQDLQEHLDDTAIGVEALTSLLGIPATQCTKTVLFMDALLQVVVAVVRADREVSEEKLRALHKSKLRLATSEEIFERTGAPSGFAGLYNLPEALHNHLYIDNSCEHLINFETGGNKAGLHVTNFNWDRDMPKPQSFYDVKKAQEGDIHPESNEKYVIKKSAEVGNIFDLGTKYTDPLGVRYTDENNEQKTPFMGCHGIGITRIIGVLAEVHSDEKGLVWPESVTPFMYHLISYAGKNDPQEVILKIAQLSQEFYDSREGEVLWDDRGVSMGEKLSDSELIGCPYTIVVSSKGLESNRIELRQRKTGEVKYIEPGELKNFRVN